MDGMSPGKALKKQSKMMKLYPVRRRSAEWDEVVSNLQSPRTVTRIERVQNSRLYRAYYRHCKELALRKGVSVQQLSVWHGTRQTAPDTIWKGSGFDVRFANVGGCIWFALQNSYSMAGYQYTGGGVGNQVFLAFVACGDQEAVKFIRGGQILNVYKNETMYPGYIVTYQ